MINELCTQKIIQQTIGGKLVSGAELNMIQHNNK